MQIKQPMVDGLAKSVAKDVKFNTATKKVVVDLTGLSKQQQQQVIDAVTKQVGVTIPRRKSSTWADRINMAHSYVEFRGKGFHLNDSDLVVFARLLALNVAVKSAYSVRDCESAWLVGRIAGLLRTWMH